MIQKNRKKALVLAISSALWGTAVYAQEEATTPDTDEAVGEVIVKGVRASQAKAIDIKRNNANIVDSIVAEDIGKLPDATITDSLQRVTGVQIKREANEGTALNIRGMPQVMSALNGEQFLSPWNITEVGANFGDIPAGMIAGADVYKSQSAKTLAGGISGMINLKTVSPLSLKEGFTGNLRIEGSQGHLSKTEYKADGSKDTRQPDSSINVFVGNNFDGAAAFTLAGFHSTSYAANYGVNSNIHFAFLDHKNGTPGDPLDLNQNGDTVNDWYMVPDGFRANSSFVERVRDGASFGLEIPLGESFTLKGDIFYTKMDQSERRVEAGFSASATEKSFHQKDNPNPKESDIYDLLLPDSVVADAGDFTYVDLQGNTQTRHLHTVQVAHVMSPEFMSNSGSNINRTEALNSSIQLSYNNSDNLEASVRYVYAEAAKSNRYANLQQGQPAWDFYDSKIKDIYDLTVDYRGEFPSFSFPSDPQLTDLTKLKGYQVNAGGDDVDASLNVLRGDAKLTLDKGIIESVEAGIRYGVRDANNSRYRYMTPTGRYPGYDPKVPADKKWQLLPGNAVWTQWAGFRTFNPADENKDLVAAGFVPPDFPASADNPLLTQFRDFGPVKGLETGVSAVNPSAWDAPLVFMRKFYPGTKSITDPSFQYEVTESTASGFFQLNLVNDDWIIPFKGDVGVKIIETDREIVKSRIPEVLDKFNSVGYDSDRVAFVSESDTYNRSFTDVLPSVNMNFFPADDVVLRFGAAKTMTTNNLDNVGQSLTVWTTDCEKKDVAPVWDGTRYVPQTVRCVSGGSDTGNVDIKPWRANVYNAAGEWYFDKNAILGVGIFMIDVRSAVQSGQEQRHFLDYDGIDRGTIANVWASKNVGASKLYGFEMGYKQPFTFLPGAFLSATGIELNYTYSQSESTDSDLYGELLPLQSNSKHQSNMILWYDKSGFNFRVAYNYRSAEYLGRAGVAFNGAIINFGQWAEPTGYLDVSASYYLNQHLNLYVSGNNLTVQNRRSYSQFSGQFNSNYAQERKLNMGITLSL